MALGIPTPQFDTSDKLQEMMQQAQTVTEQPISQPPQTESEEQGMGQKLIQALALITAMRGKRNKPLEAFMAMEIGKRNAKRQKMMDDLSQQRIDVQNRFANTKEQDVERKSWQRIGNNMVKVGPDGIEQQFSVPKDSEFRVVGDRILYADPNTGKVINSTPEEYQEYLQKRESLELEGKKQDIATDKAKEDEIKTRTKQMKDNFKLEQDKLKAETSKVLADIDKSLNADKGTKLSTVEKNAVSDSLYLARYADQAIDMLKGKDAKVIKQYMGNNLSGILNRAFSTQGDVVFLPDLPQPVNKFLTKVKQMRDLVQRERTGAAINESELKFYEDLLGGMSVSPESLITKFEETKNGYKLNIETIIDVATGNFEGAEKLGPRQGPLNPNDLPDDATYGATDEQINKMTIDELKTYTEKGVVPERLRNQNKNQDEE